MASVAYEPEYTHDEKCRCPLVQRREGAEVELGISHKVFPSRPFPLESIRTNFLKAQGLSGRAATGKEEKV